MANHRWCWILSHEVHNVWISLILMSLSPLGLQNGNVFIFFFHFVAEVILLTDASFSSPLCLQFMWERGKNADADSFFDSRNGKVLQPNIYVDCVLARPPVLLFVSF